MVTVSYHGVTMEDEVVSRNENATERITFGCLEGDTVKSDEKSEEKGYVVNEGDTDDVVRRKEGENNDVVRQGRGEVTVAPLPSSSGSVQHEKATGSEDPEVIQGEKIKCVMKNLKCETHLCDVVKVKTKVKKWAYLDKKKQWGYKHSTAVRLLCKSGSVDSGAKVSGKADTDQALGIKSDGRQNEKGKSGNIAIGGEGKFGNE